MSEAVLEFELVCSDPEEHRRRLETRSLDIDGLENPTWQAVLDRHYDPWTRERIVLDTASVSLEDTIRLILDHVRSDRPRRAVHIP